MMNENELIEMRLLLDAVYVKYGYDFRNYSENHLIRRFKLIVDKTKSKSISDLQHKILYDEEVFNQFLKHLSINVTEMFRNPEFFKKLREEVVPVLKSYPHIKVWVAGCATGQEAYSIAIILKEAGLLNKSLIYATDMNELVLSQAREAIFSMKSLDKYTTNFNQTGNKNCLDQYYTNKDNEIHINEDLRKKIIFANHNLVTDGTFGEMNLIICRNVLIYFDSILQDRVLKLFLDSLCTGGFLGLGNKEDIKFTPHNQLFDVVDKNCKLYQKKYI